MTAQTAARNEDIYCLRCRQPTANAQPPELVYTSKGRARLKAVCTECNRNKSQWAKNSAQ